MRFESELLIAASTEIVWDLTIDVESWPRWTPTMRSVELLDPPPVQIGSRARIEQPRSPASVWTVEVLEPGRRFVWATSLGGARMVAGHELTAEGDGCRNRLTVDLEGRGSGLLGRLVGKQIQAAIVTENDGFRAAAEARSAAG